MVTQTNPNVTPQTNPYSYLNTGSGTTSTGTLGSSTTAGDSRTQLASNYNTFLTLLTSQLQNQDPLSPMDSTAFTQQLVQFSQVEQQIKTNEELTGLADQYKAASAGSALSYLGRDAIIQSNTAMLANNQANWAYNLSGSADDVTLTVRDAHNRDVFSTDGQKTAGDHLFTWDGKDSSGHALAPGPYQLVVTAKNNNGDSVNVTTSIRETIMGVDFSGTSPTVMTASGSHDLGTVRSVLDGS